LKNTDGSSYDYSQTLCEYFKHVCDNKQLVNNSRYYNPCKRMNVKKNIIKSNKELKHSILRLCSCSLTKDELLTTLSDYIIRDVNSSGSGVNNVVNAKFNINYCREGNGIENVVMYDANVNIDLGVYVSLASTCKDRESVERVLKYVFNNPNDDVLGTVAESLLVQLKSSHPNCYPDDLDQTRVSEYGVKLYNKVLGHTTTSSLNNTLLTSNKFIECFKKNPLCLAVPNNSEVQPPCREC
jgi:hypothetical protein